MANLRILSLDFDGCLFNKNFIEARANANVVDHNEPFFESLNLGDEETIALIGSNRQCYRDDLANAFNHGAGSCVPAIKHIVGKLQSMTAQNVTLDPFLMADLYTGLPHGIAFEQISQDIKPGTYQYKEWLSSETTAARFPTWKFDEEKLTIIYAQLHKMAMEHPFDTITFDFYDDRQDILGALSAFFDDNPQLIPANVMLNLHHYNGEEPTLQTSIRGIGATDEQYTDTVKKMADINERQVNLEDDPRLHTVRHVTTQNLVDYPENIRSIDRIGQHIDRCFTMMTIALPKGDKRQQLEAYQPGYKQVMLRLSFIYLNSAKTPADKVAYEGAIQGIHTRATDMLDMDRHPKRRLFAQIAANAYSMTLGLGIPNMVNYFTTGQGLLFSQTNSQERFSAMEKSITEFTLKPPH